MILLELRADQTPALSNLHQQFPDNVRPLPVKRFDGGADVVHALIHLSYLMVPVIAKVIIEQIRARRHVSIKANGLEVTGITEKNAETLLTGLVKARAEEQPPPLSPSSTEAKRLSPAPKKKAPRRGKRNS